MAQRVLSQHATAIGSATVVASTFDHLHSLLFMRFLATQNIGSHILSFKRGKNSTYSGATYAWPYEDAVVTSTAKEFRSVRFALTPAMVSLSVMPSRCLCG